MNAGTFLYENYIKPQLSDFMGSIFEDICRQYLYRPDIYPTLPFPFGTLDRWWGSNPAQKRQEEIDIAAIGENRILLGECKWKNGKVGADVLMSLVERGTLFSYPEKYYYVFSKSGFEKTTKNLAEEFGIRRISFAEML